MLSRFFRYFILQIGLFLFIPILGWTLGGPTPLFSQFGSDVLAFFQHPARLAFAVLALIQATLRGVMAARIPLPPIPAALHSELQHWRNIALESILVLAPFSDRRDLIVWAEVPALRWLGVILFAAGMGWVLWSFLVYARHEKAQLPPPSPQLLLISGPYKRIRYPVQLGMWVFSLGMALLFRSWIGLVLLVFMGNYILMRIREEEQHNRVKYGIQWAAYIKESWRLIPRLY